MARRYDDPPRSRSLRNDGDKYLTSEERARLIEPPLTLSDPRELGQFLGYLREDNKRIIGEYLPDIDGDLKAISRDLARVVLFTNGITNGIEGGPDQQGAAIAAAIALAAKNTTAAPSPSASSSSSGHDPGLFFNGESNAFAASTEAFLGSDAVVGATQAAAGCRPYAGPSGKVFTRCQANFATAPAAAATVRLNLYQTNDGVNFTLLGFVTFTGDGARKSFDSAALSAAPGAFTASSTAGSVGPQFQTGVVSSALLTTKAAVLWT